jgi:hypothetical protein
MAAAVGVPLFTSSLLQVPIVYRMLKPGQVIGILTAHSDAMNPRVLEAVGADGVPHVVGGSQVAPDFYNVFVQNRDWIDTDRCESQLVALATGMIEAHPQIGAFVCEGTNFSSWGRAIQQATGRPFFDIVTMTRWVYDAVVKPPVTGGSCDAALATAVLALLLWVSGGGGTGADADLGGRHGRGLARRRASSPTSRATRCSSTWRRRS